MERGALPATVYGVAKKLDTTEQVTHTHTCTRFHFLFLFSFIFYCTGSLLLQEGFL